MLNSQATNASALPTGCTPLAPAGAPIGTEEGMYEPYKYWDPFVERDDGREEENQ